MPVADSQISPRRPSLAVVTLDYPPVRGGIQTLAHEIYSRLADRLAFLLAPAHPRAAAWDAQDIVPVERTRCGVESRLARIGFALEARRRLRALPASVPLHCLNLYAARAAGLDGRRRYCLWVHGEELLRQKNERALRRCLTGAELILANSRFTAGVARRLAGERPPIVVVPLGAPPEWLRRPPSPQAVEWRRRLAPPDIPLVLTVSRLSRRDRYKGVDLSLEACARLRRMGAEFRLAVVGDGDYAAVLQHRAHAAGIADWVHWLGNVEEASLVDLYDACDLFLLNSRAERGPRGLGVEGFGIVFLEAAARGKPAIGGRSGGIPDAVEDGVTGILVDPDDPRALAEALRQLLSDPAARARLGQAARARVEREYHWNRSAQLVWEAHRRYFPSL